jgi:prepilin peptidase CpaA
MAMFSWENWPLLFLCSAMIVCAVIDGWKLRVPNWLTFPLIVSGWLLGLVYTCGLAEGKGGLGSSFTGSMLGFGLLLPIYAIGGMGAGDVKMQMGFGAWIGAVFGMSPGMKMIFYAFCAAVIIGGGIALVQIVVRGQYGRNLANTRAIVGDLFGAPNIGTVADRAAKRKPTMHLLPYGIPLCLGSVGYLIFLFS